jgi:hypothetical protein
MPKQPGLDGRHRDENGQISRKHGNTLVGTLRQTYGDAFAAGTPSDAKLSTVLNRTGANSLSDLLKVLGYGRIDQGQRNDKILRRDLGGGRRDR